MSDLLNQNKIQASDLENLLNERGGGNVSFILVDVREQYEYDKEHIVGVDYLLPLSNLGNDLEKIDPHKESVVILQCKSGGRSLQAQRYLTNMGFQKTINMEGGISAYSGPTKK